MERDSDFIQFCNAWKLAYRMVNAKEPDGEVISAVYSLLEPYPLQAVMEAINYHVSTSEFVIKPANVINYINTRLQCSGEQIKTKAYRFFDTQLMHLNNEDAVFDDAKYALAFGDCFGAVSSFLVRPLNDFAVSKDRELFANTVMSYLRQPINENNVKYVFYGSRNFKDLIYVQFLGNYDRCRRIAERHYSMTGENQHFKLIYPADPTKRLEHKTANQPVISENQRAENLQMLSNVLKTLTRA